MKLSIFTSAAVIAVAALNAHASEPLRSVHEVELERYAGTWYEQARLPMFFQRKCAKNTTATYTLQPNGEIGVKNQCETNAGDSIEAIGRARPELGSTSRLKVTFAPSFMSFLPFVWADYWVVDLDPEYRWAVIGEPGRKYLWILSREKKLPEKDLGALVDRARAKGFPTQHLIYTLQD